MTTPRMDPIKVQAQIRANSEEVASFVSDLGKWEKDMKTRDQAIRQGKARKVVRPPRAGSGTVQVLTGQVPTEKSASAAKHTYDVGYKKWESFTEDDSENVPSSTSSNYQTPASITQVGVPLAAPSLPVPRARGVASQVDAEAVERERGNDEFKAGNFNAAVKLYTKCLGMKVRNFVAFSNRAMAYLKLKEFLKAEADCTCALNINPEHVKSLSRRATARNALGKHRAAVADLIVAEGIEPSNKAIKADLAKSRELLRNAVSRAPLVCVQVSSEDGTDAGTLQGPDMPSVSFMTASIQDDEKPKNSPVDAPAFGGSGSSQETKCGPNATPTTNQDQSPLKQYEPHAVKSAKTKISNLKKKAVVAKKPAQSNIAGGYDLERSLRVYKGQTALMEKYLDTLSPSDAPILLDKLMEGDVLAMLLIEVGKLHGSKRGNWEVVIEWFQRVSAVSSFRLLVSLISATEKDQLMKLLDRSVQVVSEDAMHLPDTVHQLKVTYGLVSP